jgi:hypothetical protein
MPSDEVETHVGAPVVNEVMRSVPPVLEATCASELAEAAYVIAPGVYEEIPVPPFPATSVPESVSVPVSVTGPPLKESPVVPPEASSDVTEPEPPPPLLTCVE